MSLNYVILGYFIFSTVIIMCCWKSTEAHTGHAILLFFHPSILPSSNTVNSICARVSALVSFILDRFDGCIKEHVYSFISCSNSRLNAVKRNSLTVAMRNSRLHAIAKSERICFGVIYDGLCIILYTSISSASL